MILGARCQELHFVGEFKFGCGEAEILQRIHMACQTEFIGEKLAYLGCFLVLVGLS